MQRKSINPQTSHRSISYIKSRLEEEANQSQFVFGRPIRPEGLPKRLRTLWNATVNRLFETRRISTSDGVFVLDFINARDQGDRATSERLAQMWINRPPFPLSPAELKLQEEEARNAAARRYAEEREIHAKDLAEHDVMWEREDPAGFAAWESSANKRHHDALIDAACCIPGSPEQIQAMQRAEALEEAVRAEFPAAS